MAKLRKIISGGQTGADRVGLECARALGLETGGTVPKGCRTDVGPDLSLKELFGVVESDSPHYSVRTLDNVRDSDATVWFGKTGSPGYWCTRNATAHQSKPFFINPSEQQLEYIVNSYEIVNVAGNRLRINAEVPFLVKAAFRVIAKVLGKEASF